MTSHSYTDELIEVNQRLRLIEGSLEYLVGAYLEQRNTIAELLKQHKTHMQHAKLLADTTRRLIEEKAFLQRCLGIQAQASRQNA